MESSKKVSCVLQLFTILTCFLYVLIASFAGAQTLTTLYSFTGSSDGGWPAGDLIPDAKGNLYGTTLLGGDLTCNDGSGCGTVFKLSPSGRLTVLYKFHGKSDGIGPVAVVLTPAGTLYGTTGTGGNYACEGGCGTVFKLDGTGYHLVYSFHGPDGEYPEGALTLDSAGNMYGLTLYGANVCQNGFSCGVIFRIDPRGNEKVVHAFTGKQDGAFPSGGLFITKGYLYGLTSVGGSNACQGYGCGTVFRFDKTGDKTVLYGFGDVPDGNYPSGYFTADGSGNIYGTTVNGGIDHCSFYEDSCGTIFELTPNAMGVWAESVLYRFSGNADEEFPVGVIRDAVSGDLYGTTARDYDCPYYPDSHCGTIFKLDTNNSMTVLYSFIGGPDGYDPGSRLLRDRSGNLYGTTVSGGSPGCLMAGCGTIYKFTP